jgi:hypothetical protein
MAPYIEDLSRIRVNEAIQNGIQSQKAHRALDQKNKSHGKIAMLMLILAFFLAIAL